MKKQKNILSRIGYLCLFMLICIVNPLTGAVRAATVNNYEIGNGDNIYQLDQLIAYYKSSSTEYKRGMLSYEINFYDSDLATEKYDAIIFQYSQAGDNKGKLEAAKAVYQDYLTTEDDPGVIAEINTEIEKIDQQIGQYNSNMATLQSSKSEAKLQKDVEQFYKDNLGLLKQETENKLTTAFIKKIYSLIILKEQQDYYEAYQNYMDTEYAVAIIKYQKGLIDNIALQVSETNQAKSSIDLQQNNDVYQSTLSSIKDGIGILNNCKLVLPISPTKKEYDIDKTISIFECNNASLVQLKHLQKSYQDYQYANSDSNTLCKQIGLKVQDYQLQYDQLKADIEKYVKDTISSYKKAWLKYDLTAKELKIAENNYSNVMLKMKYKIATQLDAKKAAYEFESLQVSYYQSLYNIIVLQNILDYCIYGETV